MHTVESNPELFRTEEWTPPKGARVASWIAIAAGSFLGASFFGGSGGYTAWELTFMALLFGCVFAGRSLQGVLLRRGGATTTTRWLESNAAQVFGSIEIQGSKVERAHFAAAGIAPTALLGVLAVGYLAVVPRETAGIVAMVILGAVLGGTLKQVAYAALVLRRPRGTLVEELEGGALRFHEPVVGRP